MDIFLGAVLEGSKEQEMAKEKLSEEKSAAIKEMIRLYDIKSAKDFEEAFKDMFGPVLQSMLEGELDAHLGYEKYERNGNGNSRNGHSKKTVETSVGEVELEIPRDREGTFEPQAVKKYQRDVSGIEDKVISMYAKGMSTRDISEHLGDIYGIEASAEMISKITDRILPEVREWQSRQLEEKYAVVFLDAVHYHVRDEGQVVKKAVYIALGVRLDGRKEVLGMYVGANEGAKYWLGVLNNLKSRGVKDILICCVDGLTGFPEAIEAVFPQTDVQRCIIHQIRSSTRFVTYKDLKAFSRDLRPVYRANTQDEAWGKLLEFEKAWGAKYPSAVKSWKDNWNELTTYFRYPPELRRLIYTTNTIEGFNRQLRKVTKTRSVFPSDDALLKLLYLAMRDATKKWTMSMQDWSLIVNQILILYPERFSVSDFI